DKVMADLKYYVDKTKDEVQEWLNQMKLLEERQLNIMQEKNDLLNFNTVKSKQKTKSFFNRFSKLKGKNSTISDLFYLVSSSDCTIENNTVKFTLKVEDKG